MEDLVDSYGVEAGQCDEQEETSTLRPRANDRGPNEWTNEKHSLYLESMEATFVNQLNKSLNLSGRHSHKSGHSGAKSSMRKHGNFCASSGHQFTVLRDGRWSKIHFPDEEVGVGQKESLLENQWIKHYRTSQRLTTVKVPNDPRLKDPPATRLNQSPANNFRFWRQDSVGSNAEVIGQNFIEEGIEDQASRVHEMKRTRKSSRNDQVVP